MSFSVAQSIRELLFDQECVIIPGFGGFITSYKSAVIDHIAHTISPPTKSISFNRQLRNDDGLLANAYSLLNVVSYKEAQTIIRNWSATIEDTLKQKGELALENIGVFEWNAETNTIQFKSINTENFLAESYGFPTVIAEPIYRNNWVEKTTETITYSEVEIAEEIHEPTVINTQSKTNYLLITALAACIIGFIAMPIFKLSVPSLNFNQASVYSLLAENLLPKSSLSLSPKSIDKEFETTQLSTAQAIKIVSPVFVKENKTEAIQEEVIPTPTPPHTSETSIHTNYILVIGVFKEEQNALSTIAKTKNEHPEFSVISFKKGNLNYVAIVGGETKSDALVTLQKAKDSNIDCWLKR